MIQGTKPEASTIAEIQQATGIPSGRQIALMVFETSFKEMENGMGSIEEFFVHQITSGPNTFLTNAFLVETSGSVVAVDAMMTVSDARDLRRHVDNLGKPLRAVLITHGHPDHYNGVGELLKGLGKIPVVATESVARTMRRIDDAKEIQWRPVFGEEWPKERVFPDLFVIDRDTLLFDGVPFTVRELGPGESSCDLFWTVGGPSRVAFAGDVVFGRVHSFMNDGHTSDWLASLDILEKELNGVEILYAGHGDSGRPFEMIDEQRRYLLHYRKMVGKLAKGETSLDVEAKKNLVRAMKEHLPTEALEVFIAAGADAVASELRAASDSSTVAIRGMA